MKTKQEIHDAIVEDLQRFRAMDTSEYILWQKWEEVNDVYPMEESGLFGEPAYQNDNHARLIPLVKSMLWDGDLEDLVPELIHTNDPDFSDIQDHWTCLRIMIHSQQHSGSIGRGFNYIIRDKVTKKYLGVVAFASDFLDLTCRDNAIGWTREQRTQEQRIKHTAVCSTIVPVQPFGYNMLGGKLLSLLCLSDTIQSKWNELYGCKLVGLTTTSLYGKNKGGHGMSQYDNLKYWKKMGYSTGSAPFKLAKTTQRALYEYAEVNNPEVYEKYFGGGPQRDFINRFTIKMMQELGIKTSLAKSNHDRGIYFAPLYKNAYEFLRDEIPEEKLEKLPDMSVEALTSLWKTKYARQRYKKLSENNGLKSNTLFYDDLSWLSWDEAKKKYLSDVGR